MDNFDKPTRDQSTNKVKSLSIKCTQENGREFYEPLYVGNPKDSKNPVFFQIRTLQEEKGYMVDQECVEYLKTVQEIAKKRGVVFLDLLDYVLNNNLDTEKT